MYIIMYSYPIMHSTTFPNANIFSKEKPRTRNIHPFIHIYFFPSTYRIINYHSELPITE